ncbi:MAG: pseudoazurin [Pseudomonadota bacterium]
MSLLMNRRLFMGVSAAATLATPAFASGATHQVEMLSVDPDNPRNRNVFLPRIQVIQPGDTVTFVPTDRGHNSESVEEMTPEGFAGWEGQIGKEVSAVLDQPGFYGYICTPHATVGMVGLVVVEGEGMLDNLEAAKGARQRGRAKGIWEEIWEEVDAMGLTS